MEKNNLFPIGAVAKMFHLSVGTLRHYEKMGLLIPEYIDAQTGYRYYSTKQFEVLNTIRYLRVLDTPLPQIVEFLKDRDVEHMKKLLYQQKQMVVQKKNELEIIEKKIVRRLQQIEDAATSELNKIKFISCPPKRINWIRSSLSIHSYLDLELSIRQLEGSQENAVVFLGKIGVGITASHLKEREFSRYDMVFLLLEPEDDYNGSVEELPAETCVSLRFCGSHAEAPAYYEKLLQFIEKHNFEIVGFSKEITMIDYGITNDTDKFVTEIQIPVTVK